MQPIPTAALTTAAQRALANPAATRMLASGIQRAATTGGRAGSAGGGNAAAAASAASMAPLAAAALPSLMSAASAHGAGGNRDDRNVNAPPPPSSGIGFGRVAAAAQAFSGSGTAPGAPASPPAKAANPNKLVPQKVSGQSRSTRAWSRFSPPSPSVGSADPCSPHSYPSLPHSTIPCPLDISCRRYC